MNFTFNDLEKKINSKIILNFVNFISRYIGRFLVIGVPVTILGSFLSLTNIVLPFYSTSICHYFLSSWMVILILFNFYKAVQSKPYDLSSLPSFPLICQKCEGHKPPKTHHCSICNICVYKMDHHCPWINNCVGYHNHRYFLLFLIYTLIGCLYFTLMSFNFILDFVLFNPEGNLSKSVRYFLFLTNIWSIIIIVFLFGFILWNLFLIGNNLTTIEFYYGSKKQNCTKEDENISKRISIFFRTLSNNLIEIFFNGKMDLYNIFLILSPTSPLHAEDY